MLVQSVQERPFQYHQKENKKHVKYQGPAKTTAGSTMMYHLSVITILPSMLLMAQGFFFTDKQDAEIPSYGKRAVNINGLLMRRLQEEHTDSDGHHSNSVVPASKGNVKKIIAAVSQGVFAPNVNEDTDASKHSQGAHVTPGPQVIKGAHVTFRSQVTKGAHVTPGSPVINGAHVTLGPQVIKGAHVTLRSQVTKGAHVTPRSPVIQSAHGALDTHGAPVTNGVLGNYGHLSTQCNSAINDTPPHGNLGTPNAPVPHRSPGTFGSQTIRHPITKHGHSNDTN